MMASAANIQRVTSYLHWFAANDMDTWAELWDEQGEYVLPYSPAGLPSKLVGRDAIVRHETAARRSRRWLKFEIRHIFPTSNPDLVICRFSGRSELADSGALYENEYYGFFTFARQRLQRLELLFNPCAISEAFGSAESIERAWGAAPDACASLPEDR